MNNQEPKNMEQFKEEMKQVHKDLKEMTGKVDKMFYALMGNELAKDGGLVGRIEKLEKRIDNNELDIESIQKKNVGFEIYQKIMWTALGGLLTFVLESVFSK